ncbi:MAG: glycosyltransferase family 2 protein [Thermoflavifilum sp.]|nr:glycosyltransferase family 2 protein [Thermoflavifilum sp.]
MSTQDLRFPAVAVVILSWNGRQLLARFLPSVCRSTYPNLRIVVADNASTDDTIELLREKFPTVECIQLDRNYGFAEGYNRALGQVEADYYVLLNQDVEVEPGWIEPIIALMEQKPELAACQPKLLGYHERTYFEYAGAAGGWLDALGYPFCRGRLFYTVEPDTHQYDDEVYVFWASGAALFVRANLFHEAGGFYGDFFAHMEEIDLCWRLQRMGYRIGYCGHSVVYHLGGGSLPQGNPRKTYLNYRNNLIMMARNLNRGQRWRRIPFRMLLDLVSIVYGISHRTPPEMFAILKAHRDFIKWYRKNRRSLPLQTAPPENLQGYYPGSVIWEYFGKNRKFFSQLSCKCKHIILNLPIK